MNCQSALAFIDPNLGRFLDVKVRDAILLAQDLRRRFHVVDVADDVGNAPFDDSQEELGIVERNLAFVVQQVQDRCLVAEEQSEGENETFELYSYWLERVHLLVYPLGSSEQFVQLDVPDLFDLEGRFCSFLAFFVLQAQGVDVVILGVYLRFVDGNLLGYF